MTGATTRGDVSDLRGPLPARRGNSGCARIFIALIGVVGGLGWLGIWSVGLGFSDGLNPAVATRERIFMLLMLVAMAGLIGTTVIDKSAHVVRNCTIWLGIEIAFALTALIPYSLIPY